MQRPRWQKVLSDLRGNLGRTLLVIASIAVGLFAFGIIANLYFVIRQDMSAGYSAIQPANIQIHALPFDEDMVDSMAEMEGIQSAEGLRILSLRLESAPDEWIPIEVSAHKDFDNAEINRLSLEQGTIEVGKRQILIERYKFNDVNAQVGDFIIVETPSGQTRELELVGVVHDQTVGAYSGGGGFFMAPVQGYIHQDTLEWLGEPLPDHYNTLYLTLSSGSDDQEHLASVSELVRDEFEDHGGTILSLATRATGNHPNSPYVNAISSILLLLGLFIVFLSAFLITNTLQALLQQQVEQIGIMKTVGASRTQITGIYMMLIMFFGILAFVIAVPLTSWVSFALLDFLVYEMNFELLGFRIIPQVVIAQALIALLVPQLAAFIPILRGSSLSVHEALSGVTQANQKNKSGARRAVYLKIFPRPLLISLRNTFRSKGRMVLTLVTLSLGGAIFIATFNVQLSMSNYIELISQYFLGDINITLAYPYRVEELAAELNNLPEVEHVEGWGAASSELVNPDGSIGDPVQLLAPPAGSTLVQPKLLAGRWLLPGDQNAIALSESFRTNFPSLDVGDTLKLQVNGKEHDWVVVGFFQFAGNSVGYMAYTNAEYLAGITGQNGRAALVRVQSAYPALTLTQQEELSQEIQALLEARGYQIKHVEAGLYTSQTASNGFGILTAFLLFMAILAAIVGSIGLAGTMSMNVMERTREIGIMRAVGASNGILTLMVIIEGFLIGAISWAIGALIAFPISSLMSNSISLALFDATTQITFTPTGFVLWFVVVSFLSIAASVLPARKASRLTIREVLAYE
jgi:putative ABC transport system permease protein